MLNPIVFSSLVHCLYEPNVKSERRILKGDIFYEVFKEPGIS